MNSKCEQRVSHNEKAIEILDEGDSFSLMNRTRGRVEDVFLVVAILRMETLGFHSVVVITVSERRADCVYT